jgi:hypothetical protein
MSWKRAREKLSSSKGVRMHLVIMINITIIMQLFHFTILRAFSYCILSIYFWRQLISKKSHKKSISKVSSFNSSIIFLKHIKNFSYSFSLALALWKSRALFFDQYNVSVWKKIQKWKKNKQLECFNSAYMTGTYNLLSRLPPVGNKHKFRNFPLTHTHKQMKIAKNLDLRVCCKNIHFMVIVTSYFR